MIEPDPADLESLPADALALLQRGMALYRSDPAGAELLFGIARSQALLASALPHAGQLLQPRVPVRRRLHRRARQLAEAGCPAHAPTWSSARQPASRC
jgi:hypothetical protein